MIDLSKADWFKSSFSKDSHSCVEIAHLGDGHVGVRDSKNLDQPAMVFTPAEWDAFTAGMHAGEFNRP